MVVGWAVPTRLSPLRGSIYVEDTGEPFGPVHHVEWGGPIADAGPTALVALVFAVDPVLGTLEIEDEGLVFRMSLGVTAEEYALCAEDRREALLARLRAADPPGGVDRRRDSWPDIPTRPNRPEGR